MTDPEEALVECRELGLTEGQWVTDVRAGPCQITSLSATSVTLIAESGTPLDAGTAADFLESYHEESIRLVEGES